MIKKITVIGTDSTHCVAFTRLLNNNPACSWKISYAIRDNRSKLALSQGRFQEIESQLKDLNVELCEDLSSELVSSTDAFIIASVDASLHLDQFKQLVQYDKPIFIDKPITYSSREMAEIFTLSDQYGIAVMTSSSLRFSAAILTAKAQLVKLAKPVTKIILTGPMPIERGIPGMFWYGIHLIEMLLTLLPGHYEVKSVKEKGETLQIMCQSQQLTVEFNGDLTGAGSFSGKLETATEVIDFKQEADSQPLYSYLVEEMLDFFNTGKSKVSQEQTSQVISLVERINDKGGWR